VQDNTRLVPPLVFHPAPTHLGRGTQRQSHSSVQGPPGSETPTARLNAKVDSNNCDDSIVNLRNDNADLIAKIDKLNASLSSLKIENEKLFVKAKKLDVCKLLSPILEMKMIFCMLRLLN
jgi:hypothetical protein